MSPTATDASVADVARRFKNQPWRIQAYLALRRVLVPHAEIEKRIPPTGRILDLCCGYGMLALLAALRSPARSVVGIDIDSARIAAARAAAAGIPNVDFEVRDLLEPAEEPVDAVLLIDSLHYFAPERQLAILRSLRRALRDQGSLILREVVREVGPRYWWTWLHERVMTRLSFTQTHDRSVFLLGMTDHVTHLRSAGFRIERIEKPRWWLPYADHLFIAVATSGPNA